MQGDSHGRRSAQTAMYHIIQAMVRWIAPILAFTSEEIWQAMPGAQQKPGEVDSVLLQTWYTDLTEYRVDPEKQRDFWQQIRSVRETVSREIESLRKAGNVGSALAAEVTIYTEAPYLNILRSLGDELRFILITGDVTIAALDEAPTDLQAENLRDGKLAVEVKPTQHNKCVRCWHHRADVGQIAEHPELCGRCVKNVSGAGENRRWA